MAVRHQIKSLVSLKPKDFFGIHDITSKDIAAAFNNLVKLTPNERSKKYDSLLSPRQCPDNEEREKPRYFGAVRYDSDNVTKSHGQFEENNTKARYDTVEVKQKFVPDEGGGSEVERCSNMEDGVIIVPKSEQTHQIGNAPYKISEVQPIKDLHEVLDLFKYPNEKIKYALRYSRKPPLTFYFDGVSRETNEAEESELKTVSQPSTHQKDEPQSDPPEEPKIEVRRPQIEYDALAGPEGLKVPLHELDPMSEEYMEREYEENKSERFDRNVDKQFEAPEEPSKPMKALEYLKKVRAKKIEPVDKKLKQHLNTAERPYSFKPEIMLDSKGFRVYTHQVPDWSRIRRVDALSYIRKCIAYNNYDILAINKPYGIASHEGIQTRDSFDMNSLVGELAKSMRIDKVYLAHRLDKTTTGILLFATSESAARHLSKLFKSGEIKKTYWCITKGVPDPYEGVVDIPIGDFQVSGKRRSVPVPESLDDDKQLAKRFREARRAVTEYKVLDQTDHMALVECRPQSGVKHQIRCHLGFGLKTPILGDHKYSHLNKVAPQQLHQRVLNALSIRQSKVRTLPNHLHAKSIVIPNAKANGETLFIHADLPQHFRDNLKTLGLKRLLDS